MKHKKYTAVIVDAEHDAREITALLLRELFPVINIVGKISSITKAVQLIPSYKPDIIFLDVKMADGSGFDLLKRLPDLPSLVIFTTANNDFAIKAIKASVFDYILKPVDVDEFSDAVNKAIKKLEGKGNVKTHGEASVHHDFKKIGLPNLLGYKFVEAQTILRCEAYGHYTNVHFTDTKKTIISRSLSHFDGELARHGFFRIHHKHLINLQFVTGYSKGKGGGYIIMADGSELEVSTRKKPELLKTLSRN
jgi:two-component system, LytTR family, response regulator